MPRPLLDASTTALITGASAGIGRELARQMAPRVGGLALVARRRDRLETLKAELLAGHPALAVHMLPCDLRDLSSIEAMLATLDAEAAPVDLLVNNAGLGDQALFDQASWERILPILQVNILALVRITHHLIPKMVARRHGAILNISSGAGLALMAGAAAYVGSKHFVNGFTEALRVDLRGTGVFVSQASPGPVATEFAEVAQIRGTEHEGGTRSLGN